MRLRKHEREQLAALLEQGAETPELLAEEFVKHLDQLRGERSHHYACAIVAGIPMTIGPYSTKGQAERALAKFPVDRAWAVPGWTAEGWVNHIAEVDKEPPPRVTEQLKGGQFWGRVQEIKDHERTALVGQRRQDVEIKPLKLPRGAWG